MLLYLAADPSHLAAVRSHGCRLAHAAYGVGRDSRLVSSLPPDVRGGLLLLTDHSAPAQFNPELLCKDVLQEFSRRGFSGVVLDFEGGVSGPLAALTRSLDEQLFRRGLRLCVPESWAAYAGRGTVLICSALSGGSLRERLEQAKARFSPRPAALDCQRLAMDFLLPSPNGEGMPLSREQLSRMREGHSVYFSEELCARYFTYATRTHTHFVLFDDADTIRRKIRLAEELGYEAAFLMLPETEDLLPELFPAKE